MPDDLALAKYALNSFPSPLGTMRKLRNWRHRIQRRMLLLARIQVNLNYIDKSNVFLAINLSSPKMPRHIDGTPAP